MKTKYEGNNYNKGIKGLFPSQVSLLGKFYYLGLLHIICRIIGFLLIKKVNGLESVPQKGPFLVIPNHSSFVDFMLVMDSIRKRRFLTFFIKIKYFDMKIWNHFLLMMCQLRADNNSIKKSLKVLKGGFPVVLFAEGTRTKSGDVGGAYPGLGIVSSMTNVPIIPMGIKGAFQFWPWNKKIPNLLQGRMITISFGEPIQYQDFSDANEFSKSVMNEVRILAR